MVAAASVQRQPDPANVQGDPIATQGTDGSKVSKVTGRGRTVLDTPGHTYSLINAPFQAHGSVLVWGICFGGEVFLKSLHKTLIFCLFL